MTSELERVCDPGYLGELEGRPLDEVRRMRQECQSVETGLSYLRRLVQGRLDIATAELERRLEGGDASLEALIARLPEVLADRTRTGGTGRLPQTVGPGDVDEDLAAELDAINGGQTAFDRLDDEALSEVARQLAELELRVSACRRTLFDRLDALQAEIARRYRTGEASVESLLP